jgi:hypothetical protein
MWAALSGTIFIENEDGLYAARILPRAVLQYIFVW